MVTTSLTAKIWSDVQDCVNSDHIRLCVRYNVNDSIWKISKRDVRDPVWRCVRRSVREAVRQQLK